MVQGSKGVEQRALFLFDKAGVTLDAGDGRLDTADESGLVVDQGGLHFLQLDQGVDVVTAFLQIGLQGTLEDRQLAFLLLIILQVRAPGIDVVQESLDNGLFTQPVGLFLLGRSEVPLFGYDDLEQP